MTLGYPHDELVNPHSKVVQKIPRDVIQMVVPYGCVYCLSDGSSLWHWQNPTCLVVKGHIQTCLETFTTSRQGIHQHLRCWKLGPDAPPRWSLPRALKTVVPMDFWTGIWGFAKMGVQYPKIINVHGFFQYKPTMLAIWNILKPHMTCWHVDDHLEKSWIDMTNWSLIIARLETSGKTPCWYTLFMIINDDDDDGNNSWLTPGPSQQRTEGGPHRSIWEATWI